MSMSRKRFDQIFSGLSTVAKKVYEVVPIADAWTIQKVAGEIQRQNMNVRADVLAGCLDTLRSAGLVKEPKRGHFQREGVRDEVKKPEPINESKEQDMTSNATTEKKLPPMDRLGQLGARAAEMAKMIQALAEDINNAAIDIQSQLESAESDLEKLRQLQALLASIGEKK